MIEHSSQVIVPYGCFEIALSGARIVAQTAGLASLPSPALQTARIERLKREKRSPDIPERSAKSTGIIAPAQPAARIAEDKIEFH